jgi:hypothetical protein
MVWPRKIAHAGPGSNRTGLVPRPRSDTKKIFMQEAVLIMLANSQAFSSIEIMVSHAETLFNMIEERSKNDSR